MSGKLSRAQIFERLGYKPEAEWQKNATRGSGTTTRMIVSVLEYLQDYPNQDVYIGAHTYGYAKEIVTRIKKHAGALGFDATNVRASKVTGYYESRMFFIDHYAWGVR